MKHAKTLASTAAVVMALSAPAFAGGMSRPIKISPRATGMGGAYVAAASDPTALFFNPAALSLMEGSQLLLGGELIFNQLSYKPIFANGTEFDKQSDNKGPMLAPVAAWATRLKVEGAASRLSFGVGLWNTVGGRVNFDPAGPGVPSFNTANNYNLELAPGLAYQVNDVLSVGATFRVALGVYNITGSGLPGEIDLSSKGFGIGGSLGVLVTPTENFRIGLNYRSSLNITTTGTAELSFLPETQDVEFIQRNPQALSMGVAVRVAKPLLISTEVEWINMQAQDTNVIRFTGVSALDDFEAGNDWSDAYAFKVGGEYLINAALAARLGFLYDRNVIPDSSITRDTQDTDKIGFTGGASYQIHKLVRVDAALGYLKGFQRSVEDNEPEATAAGWPDMANPYPGDYSSGALIGELAVALTY
jgi:long-chain fatty acid transport protein